jgi:SRSO17 transposase
MAKVAMVSVNWRSCLSSLWWRARSNHGVWLPPGQRVRYTNWRPFERSFSNGDHHTRDIRELVFGQRGRMRSYHLTTDPNTLPPESTWYIMTN